MADRAMAQVSTDPRWTSDGYYFRDINPNHNGFAMHCGLSHGYSHSQGAIVPVQLIAH